MFEKPHPQERFDCVALMRGIREEMAKKYLDPEEEEKFLEELQQKYRMDENEE